MISMTRQYSSSTKYKVNSIPLFIRIGNTYHNTNMIRNITEIKNDNEKSIKVEIHGQYYATWDKNLFKIETIKEKDISNSLKILLRELKENDKDNIDNDDI